MAKIKGGTKGGLNDSLFRETIGEIVTPADSGKVVDIIEFSKSSWGLGLNLTPVQGFMIKALYGLPMDSENAYIEIPDVLNAKRLYDPMTEVEFAKWSYEEGRCNVDFSDPNNWGRDFYNFVMALGRRSGKCRKDADIIATTVGSISFKDLLRRKQNENIGISTYDPKTYEQKTTYDFKIWSNGLKECKKITTETGFSETSTPNHPYLIMKNGSSNFVDLKDVKVGDKIATPKSVRLFGKEKIGINKAKLLGFFCKDKFTDKDLQRMENLLNEEINLIIEEDNLHISSGIEQWLEEIDIFNNAENKVIPKCIYEGSEREVCAFLSSLSMFKDEGLNYISQSYNLIYGIKHLLIKLGVNENIVEKEDKEGVKTYTIKISEVDKIESGIYWDTVKSIEDVGKFETVDLCVEDTHIIGGDIISHNSTICSCVVDYEFYRLFKCGDPHKLYGVPPGQEIAVIGTAPTDGQAQIVFNMSKTFAQNSPIMRDRVAHPTQTYFEIQTDADVKQFGKMREGSMQFITGGSSSNSIRGHNAIVVLIDEMAFFNETGNRFSIDEVYGALTPSIAKFQNPNTGNMDGKIICLSSPYAHFGKFYDLYRDSFSDESSKFGKTVSFRYYTALVNPDNASEDYLREEKRKDKSKFRREFEAEFDERITAWIDSEVQFRNNIKRPYRKERGERGIKYFYGFDFGSTDNGASIAIVHKKEEAYFLNYAEVFYPKNSPVWEATVCTLYKEHNECDRFRNHEVLPLFEIADYIKLISKDYPLFTGVIDQYSGHAIYQILTSKGVENIDLKSYNESSKARVFKLIKELYQENLLDLMDHPVLIQEMLNMEAELRPGNKIAVNKRTASDNSFQDDLTDAYVRAVWECWSYHNINKGKGKGSRAPLMVSFGNGNPVNINELDNNDIASKLRSASNFQDYRRTRGMLHGIDTNRTPQKGNTR